MIEFKTTLETALLKMIEISNRPKLEYVVRRESCGLVTISRELVKPSKTMLKSIHDET